MMLDDGIRGFDKLHVSVKTKRVTKLVFTQPGTLVALSEMMLPRSTELCKVGGDILVRRPNVLALWQSRWHPVHLWHFPSTHDEKAHQSRPF